MATSTTTAALRDFLRVLHGRFPGLPVLVAPCRVQGEGAAATVVAAVKALARHGVDVIVVTRGGGSREDLWAFNDELLARTIAASPVPVVSAVGHEIDVTVADLVADARAATPDPRRAAGGAGPRRPAGRAGGAARPAPPGHVRRPSTGGGGTCGRCRRSWATPPTCSRRSATGSRTWCGGPRPARCAPPRPGRARLEPLRARLAGTEPRARLRALRARVEAARRRLDGWQAATFRREALRLASLGARLEPANVARLLKRGFALALRDGKLVTRSAALAPGQPLRVALGEGWLDAEVTARDAGEDPVPGRGRGVGARLTRGGRRG